MAQTSWHQNVNIQNQAGLENIVQFEMSNIFDKNRNPALTEIHYSLCNSNKEIKSNQNRQSILPNHIHKTYESNWDNGGQLIPVFH